MRKVRRKERVLVAMGSVVTAVAAMATLVITRLWRIPQTTLVITGLSRRGNPSRPEAPVVVAGFGRRPLSALIVAGFNRSGCGCGRRSVG